MKLKGLFILSNIVVVAILIIIVLLAQTMSENQIELSRIHQNQLKAQLISEELKQTSEDLTNYSKSYVITGDSIWETKFWEVLDIRNGKKPRQDGRTIALYDSIKSLGLTNIELEHLKEAENKSNELVYYEKVAFNAMKGLYDDGSGNFIKKKEPDTAFAKSILFDDKFAQNKSQIFTPIHDFGHLLNDRTLTKIGLYNQKNKNLLQLIIVLSFSILFTTIISFFLNYSKILEELKILQKTQDNLLFNENLLLQTTKIAKVGGWALNLLDNKLTWSHQTKRIHDVTNSFEPSLDKALDFYIPEDKPIIKEKVQKAIDTGEPFNEELRILTLKNKMIWIRTKGETRRIDGNIVEINGTIQDINDQKKLEIELAHKRQLLVDAERIGNVGGWELNTETLKQIWTEQAYKIFEIEPTNTLTIDDVAYFIVPDSKKKLEESINRAIKFGEDYEIEFEVITPKGNHKIIKSIAKTDLKNKRIFGFIEDVTKQKEAQSIIKKHNATLKKVNKDKDRFISILAHDLRSPFGGILGLLDVLTENIHEYDKDEIKKNIILINKSCHSVYQLLENILTFVKAETRKLPFNQKNIPFNTICNDVIENLQVISNSKKITIKIHAAKKDMLYADEPMITSVLRNLISNAIKFTHINGKIDIYFKTNGTYSEIKIVDNGLGMNDEQLSKLFDISQTKSTPGTNDEKGTGLGLFICKDFIERHGGKIWVESIPEKGSTFYFKIPVETNL